MREICHCNIVVSTRYVAEEGKEKMTMKKEKVNNNHNNNNFSNKNNNNNNNNNNNDDVNDKGKESIQFGSPIQRRARR